jgi:hypothetical protein
VQRAFDRHWPTAAGAGARRQLVLGGLILIMLTTHMLEIVVWAITLLVTDAVLNFRDAFYYASITYTTLGYEDIVLPRAWRLLSPMMAMAGLFAFGWTTGVLVSIVAQSTSRVSRQH